jgi:ankyrin
MSVGDHHGMGRTPLHDSASNGYPDVCEYLLQREAKLESLDEDHYTPFLLAAYLGHVNVLKLLIQWKCDTSARNKENNGAMALACMNGHFEAVRFLVDDLHLAVNDKHQAGLTPLHFSALGGHLREAEIDGLDDDSHTPFLCATRSQ